MLATMADARAASSVNPFRPTVNIAQACELAGVSRRSIYYWLEAGKVDYIRTAGGQIRIYADSLFRRDARYAAE